METEDQSSALKFKVIRNLGFFLIPKPNHPLVKFKSYLYVLAFAAD